MWSGPLAKPVDLQFSLVVVVFGNEKKNEGSNE
jgi:hypothetical protein